MFNSRHLKHAGELVLSTLAPLAVVFACLLLLGCEAGGVSSTTPPPTAPLGSLSVTIAGLPGGAPASVTVSGPNGYSVQLTSSNVFQVAAGTYTVTGNSVGVARSHYYPAVASQAVIVSNSATASVTVDYSTIIPNSTKVLDSAGVSGLAVSPNGSTITLSTTSPVANSLVVGDVLASAPTPAAPSGLLVKVVSISRSGQTITVEVQQATLEDAIQQASFEFAETLGPGNTSPNIRVKNTMPLNQALGRFANPHRLLSGTSTGGACAGSSNTIQLPFNIQLAEAGPASATLTGESDICPSFEFDLQISSFQLVSMNAVATLGINTTIGLVDTVEESFDVEHDFDALASDPTVVLIGDVPIVVQFTLTPFVGLSGNAGASVDTGITAGSTLTIGATYASGQFSPVDTASSPMITSTATSVDGEVSLKADAGLRAGVLLDGFLAPNLSGDGYLQFASSPTDNPCWSLDAGLEANVGVDVQFLGETLASYSSPDLTMFSTPLAQATTTCFGPTLSAITPNMATIGIPQLTVALAGSNFAPDAVAKFNGQALSTTFLDPGHLTAIVPANDLSVGGAFPVAVANPDSPGGTSPSLPFTVSGVTLSISPTMVSVPVSTGQQFTATLQGASNTGVTWSVNGFVGGNSMVGTVNGQGLYTAPGIVPSPATVTVTATSQANPSVSASASVTVTMLSYGFVTIDDPAGLETILDGINAAGQIVGSFDLLVNDTITSFLYSSGSFSTIYDPAEGGQSPIESTEAYGINGSGQIVGGYTDPSDIFHGFLYSGGSFSNIDDPKGIGPLGSTASSINDSGEIVGYYEDSISNFHGFVYTGGIFSSVNYPGAMNTFAYGINDVGSIVGSTGDSGYDQQGFLYSAGSFSSIDYPGALGTNAVGINSSGQIVGWYVDQDGVQHGFLDSGGSFISIDYPGAGTSGATGINDSGQIVGYYAGASGSFHGFLATPNR